MAESILVSNREPKEVKDRMGEFGIPVELPYDFKLYTENGIVAVERKHFPGDFLASVADGRLVKEITAMRAESEFPFLIKEGKGSYNKKGILMQGRRETGWTRKGVKNLLRSIQLVEGCYVEETGNIVGTITCLKDLLEYFNAKEHNSLRNRAGLRNEWMITTYEERLLYFYQGLPGVKYKRAVALAETFGSPISLFNASIDDITKLKNFSTILAKNIFSFLHSI